MTRWDDIMLRCVVSVCLTYIKWCEGDKKHFRNTRSAGLTQHHIVFIFCDTLSLQRTRHSRRVRTLDAWTPVAQPARPLYRASYIYLHCTQIHTSHRIKEGRERQKNTLRLFGYGQIRWNREDVFFYFRDDANGNLIAPASERAVQCWWEIPKL